MVPWTAPWCIVWFNSHSMDWVGYLIKWAFRKLITKKREIGRDGSSMTDSRTVILSWCISALQKPLGHHLEALGFLSPCISWEAGGSPESTSSRWWQDIWSMSADAESPYIDKGRRDWARSSHVALMCVHCLPSIMHCGKAFSSARAGWCLSPFPPQSEC